jgi:type I restriction enzyme S subunit
MVRVADIQLGKMLQPSPQGSRDRLVPYLRAGLISGTEDFPEMYASPDDIERYGIARGDLLVAEGGDVGRCEFVSDCPDSAIIQNSLHRVRAATELDLRFIRYSLEAAYSSGWLSVLTNRSTFGHLTGEKLKALGVPWPDTERRGRVVALLDAETARIDALITKKLELVKLLKERATTEVEATIRQLVAEWGEVRLRFAVQEVTVGIVVTPAAWYADDGVPALRGANVLPGRIDLTDLVRITLEGNLVHLKSVLHAGDVVVVRTGQTGAAAVVPPSLDGANCIDLVVIRVGPRVDAEFLQHVLNSDWAQKHIDKHSVGAIQSHFNVGAMKELPIPLAPASVQREVADRLGAIVERIDGICERLSQHIGLLVEHRQALITAAMTGELDIPGAAA